MSKYDNNHVPPHLLIDLLLGSSGSEDDVLARWSNPKSVWSLSAYIRQLQRVCAQLDSIQPLASEHYQSRLNVNYIWKRLIGWEMQITNETGDVLQSWVVRGAQKDWPIDLISSRLRLSLNGYSSASLDELTAFASLMDLLEENNDS